MDNEHIEQLRQVMTVALQDYTWHPQIIDAILAATYPPACQTCEGAGGVPIGNYDYVYEPEPVYQPCPDCPTIAQLLAWGVAVATAERYVPETTGPASVRPAGGSGSWYVYADSLTTDNIVTFRDGRRACATCLAESRARASAKRRSR